MFLRYRFSEPLIAHRITHTMTIVFDEILTLFTWAKGFVKLSDLLMIYNRLD